MEKDFQKARASFIDNTLQLREELCLSNPDQNLKAVHVLCADAYDSMLWKLGSDSSEQFFKRWNTAANRIYGVTRCTFTYLIE